MRVRHQKLERLDRQWERRTWRELDFREALARYEALWNGLPLS